MEEVENVNVTRKAIPITFGSCISISLENYTNLYLSSEGFVNSKLYVEKFDQTVATHNFVTSVFKILPFANTASFTYQNRLYELLQDFTQESQTLSQDSLKGRKNFIQELRANLDAEINSNLALYNKLKGTPILFGTSSFQLVHLSTMKYLSLNDKNKDTLHFELVDHPNENSFFKFSPCLKLQRQRNNFVYDQDLVILSSTKVLLNRNPHVYTNYGLMGDNDRELAGFGKQVAGKVIANIEDFRKWRLHMYQADHEENQENNDLRVGEVIWLKLSEVNRYLSIVLKTDPFERLQKDNGSFSRKETINRSKSVDPKHVRFQDESHEDGQQKLDEDSVNDQTSVLTPFEEDFVKAPNTFYEDHLVANFELQFLELEALKGVNDEMGEMNSYGLWRLEPQNIFKGGAMAWDQPYRLKNIASGRYLKVSKKAANKYCVELSSEIDEDLLFLFVPIENLLRDEQSKKFIAKDAYFRLKHLNTKQWLSFKGGELDSQQERFGKDEEISNAPILSSTAKEIDTFKMVKANFGEIWEISFLLSAFPIFLELMDYLTPLKEKQTQSKKELTEISAEEVNRLKNFDEVVERAMRSLQTLEDFSYNKLLGNLAISQEYAKISPLRQKILKEQHVLGLLCWILTVGFPDKNELVKVEWKVLEQTIQKFEDNEATTNHFAAFTSTNLKSAAVKKRFDKIRTEYMKKKYKVCYRIYELIRTMCIQNPPNQKYVFRFVDSMINHLGYGKFVSRCFIEILRNNEKILYNLHKYSITGPKTVNSTDDSQFIRRDGAGFLAEVVYRMKEFKAYDKEELLELLKETCLHQDQAIYINQDKIFKLIYENTDFRNNLLVNLVLENEELYLDFTSADSSLDRYTFPKFFASKHVKQYKKEINFLKIQLDLYATLCLNRNYTCSKAFGKIFKLKTLIEYLRNETIPEDMRAIFVRLISTIHIDKEPRTVQEKPNLVKVVEVNLQDIEANAKRNWMSNLNTKERQKYTPLGDESPIKPNDTDAQASSPKQPLLDLTLPSPKEQPAARLVDDEITEELLNSLKAFVLDYLGDKSQLCNEKGATNDKIYTKLTFEIIKLTTMMLKFGLFKTKPVKQDQLQNPLLAPLTFGIIKRSKTVFGGLETQPEVSEVERLVKYLTPLLEFDKDYFEAMDDLNVKRRCFAKDIDERKVFSDVLFNGMSDITKGFKAFKNILNAELKKRKKGKSRQTWTPEEVQNEVIKKDQIFKKPESLKKILNKFSTKTYTIKEDVERSDEVEIKIGICDMFEYIIDMREDFVIDNIVHYFKTKFLDKTVLAKVADLDKLDLKQELNSLLPDPYLKTGETYHGGRRLKNYTEYEETKSFDDILARPFMESLLLGFFFTNSSPLQNSLLNLIQRCCTQKQNLNESVEKVELLFSDENKRLYSKIRSKIIKLKNFASNAQIWLQIIEKSLFQSLYYDIMNKCYSNLVKLQEIFKAESADKEHLKIKQKIFRYLGGHKIIFEIIQKGFWIFESYLNVFRQYDVKNLSETFRIDIAEKIVDIFKVSHSLLGLFCHGNPRHQKLLFQSFNLLTLITKVDIGQLDLICDILKGNHELALLITEKRLRVFCDLIAQHGKKEAFLKIFNILIDHPTHDISNIQKKVLFVLLGEQHSTAINPFGDPTSPRNQKLRNSFPMDSDSFFYTSKMLDIMAKCMMGNVGVTLISKAFKVLKIKDLVDLLHEQTLREHNIRDQSDNNTLLNYIHTGKNAAIDIMLTFFLNSAHALDDLPDCSKKLFDYVRLETKTLISKQYSANQIIFLLEKLVPLISIYAENYLKDSGLMNFEFGQSSPHAESQTRAQAVKFATQILGNIKDYQIEYKDVHIKNLQRLAKDMKIQPPEILTDLQAAIEEKAIQEAEQADEGHKVLRKKSMNTKRKTGLFTKFKEGLKGQTRGERESTQMSMVSNSSKKMAAVKKKQESKADELNAQLSSPDNSVRLSTLWKVMKQKLSDNEQLKKEIRSDLSILSDSIMNIINIFVPTNDKEIRDFFISTDDLLLKFLSYLQFWIQKKGSKQSIIFLVKSLGRIIKNTNTIEDMIARQTMLDRLNITRIFLILICDEKNDDKEYLYALFKFLIRLLYGGNIHVQRTLYDFFLTSPDAEKFFRKINSLMLHEISNVDQSSKYNVSKEISQLGMKILRLLQLFCENHNFELQNYLRHQFNSKTSYDLVTLTTKLLSSYKINHKNYQSVMQCFDTLAEFIQGPCPANQIALVNSKLLEFSLSLLTDGEKVVEYLGGGRVTESRSRESHMETFVSAHKKSQTVKTLRHALGQTIAPSSVSLKGSGSGHLYRRKMNLQPDQLEKVKYKCLITLVSLLECSGMTEELASRVIRAIPISVLTNNLVQVHQKYKKLYKDGQYTIDIFNHFEESYVPPTPTGEHADFIIENGFHLYTLINIFLDNGIRESSEEEDLKEMINQNTEDQFAILMKLGLFGELAKFFKSIVKGIYLIYKHFKEKWAEKQQTIVDDEEMDERERLEQQMQRGKRQLVREALMFFKDKMAHIEIQRDERLEKVYFPILPFCKHLAKDLRMEFNETVNRSSTKGKVSYLMKQSNYLIENMQHEEKLFLLFNKYKFIGLFADHVRLWEYGVFIATVLLNGVILTSYSDQFGDRLSDPHLFNQENSLQTSYGITVLGILNLIFATLVVTHFFMKKAPLLLKDVWAGFFQQKFSYVRTPFVFLLKILISIWRGLNDFNILYNMLYILFSFLGLFIHPFFFFFMMAEFLRIDELKNVVKAVWGPRVPLALTFLIFILVQYYLSIIGYTYFFAHYGGGEQCRSLWDCLLTTFDQTFKQTGAVGAFLIDPDRVIGFDEEGKEILQRANPDWDRFFFDDAAKIIPVLIVINMVAGIIIDKFGALQDTIQEKLEDMTQFCYICGIDREKLDKSTTNKQYYRTHIKRDHYMWNYVYYKAYLNSKEPTEYDGNESYVALKIQSSDLGWFPINRALAVADEQSEENEKVELVESLSKNMTELRGALMKSARRMNKFFENLDNLD